MHFCIHEKFKMVTARPNGKISSKSISFCGRECRLPNSFGNIKTVERTLTETQNGNICLRCLHTLANKINMYIDSED